MFAKVFLLLKDKTIALLGANNDRHTRAFHLFLALEKRGYDLLPICSRENTVCQKPAFPNLTTARPFPDLAFFAFSEDEEEEKILTALNEMRDMKITTALFLDDNLSHLAQKKCEEFFLQIEVVEYGKFLHALHQEKDV